MKAKAVTFAVLLQFLFAGNALPGDPDKGAIIDKTTTSAIDSSGTTGSDVAWGVYDPHGAFAADTAVSIEHIFVYWQALDSASFRKSLDYAQTRGRAIMVTVEPYTRAVNWRDGGEHLFSDIVAGDFDREIAAICSELGRFRGAVLLRWGHEMEDPSERYPWARNDPDGFKSAFRHFVTQCRRLAPDAAFVWSPKGEKNLARYYPGGAFVDFVGVSLWGLEKMDADHFGGRRGFAATFEQKYSRIAGFRKPVIIAELGVSGDNSYRDFWFKSLFDTVSQRAFFENLYAVVYFNDKEPYHWPMGYGSPDWRISAGLFSGPENVAQYLKDTSR